MLIELYCLISFSIYIFLTLYIFYYIHTRYKTLFHHILCNSINFFIIIKCKRCRRNKKIIKARRELEVGWDGRRVREGGKSVSWALGWVRGGSGSRLGGHMVR